MQVDPKRLPEIARLIIEVVGAEAGMEQGSQAFLHLFKCRRPDYAEDAGRQQLNLTLTSGALLRSAPSECPDAYAAYSPPAP